MPLLGAHMSIAGGYYKAADEAARFGMDCVQIFTKNNNQWRAREISDDEAQRFRDAMREHGLQAACSHASYLINLASPKAELWEKSVDAFVIELERAEQLGLPGVVVHPGSFVDSTEEAGLEAIVRALNDVHQRLPGVAVETWLETTAGQGSSLGHRFEQIAWILEHVDASERVGVCVDTCHIFAAGYPLGTAAEYRATMAEFDATIGLDRVRAFHLNDSKKPLGSRVDRHEHIGEGCLGLEPFRHVLNDPTFQQLPMYLETPKERDGVEMDAENIRTLRSLLKSPGRRRKR